MYIGYREKTRKTRENECGHDSFTTPSNVKTGGNCYGSASSISFSLGKVHSYSLILKNRIAFLDDSTLKIIPEPTQLSFDDSLNNKNKNESKPLLGNTSKCLTIPNETKTQELYLRLLEENSQQLILLNRNISQLLDIWMKNEEKLTHQQNPEIAKLSEQVNILIAGKYLFVNFSFHIQYILLYPRIAQNRNGIDEIKHH